MASRNKKQLSSEHLLFVLSFFVIAFSLFSMFSNVFKLSITGAETAYANVTINSSVSITLITDGVNFTSSGYGDYRESNQSTDLEPASSTARINISNTGNRPVNVTLLTTVDLFTSVVPASDNSFKCMVDICNGATAGADGSDGKCLPSDYNSTYLDCDSSATSGSPHIISNLTFQEGKDTAVVDISITVPSTEIGGTKQAAMTLTASDSLL